MMLPLGIPGLALAADECGSPAGGVVTCSAAGNPYAGGISYTPGASDLTVILSADAVVQAAVGNMGIAVTGGTGKVTIDSQGSVSTEGAMSDGIRAVTSGDIDIDAGTVTTDGDDSQAIRAEASGTGTISVDAASVSTTSNNSSGIYATSDAGNIDINVDGASTLGDAAAAVSGRSTSGAVTITNTGVITTAGTSSAGMVATSQDGAVSVTNNGTVNTAGDDSEAIMAESLTKDIQITNTGALGTAGIRAEAINAQAHQGKVVVSNSGNISTTGEDADAIQVDGNGGVTVTSTGTITTVDGTAIYAVSTAGDVLIDAVSVAAGGSGRGISTFTVDGNADIKVGSASTTSEEGSAIDMRSANGNLKLEADTLTTLGGVSHGVLVFADTGAVDLKVNAITTHGEDTFGIKVEKTSGPTMIDLGSITTTGRWAEAINVASTTGAVTVNARGTISTAEIISGGVTVATDGDVDITINDINTIGEGSSAVTANSGSGKLTVVANGAITTKGKSSVAISATSDSGDVDVTAGNIDTQRDDAHGIDANSNTGKVNIVQSGRITVRGENAHGIKASGGAGTTVIADTVSVSGYRADGIVLKGDAGIDLKIRNLDVAGEGSDAITAEASAGPVRIEAGNVRVTGENGDGIRAHTNSGSVLIDVGNVYARDGRPISARTEDGDMTVRISGKVQGFAEEIVYAEGTGDTYIGILAGGEVSSFDGSRTAILAGGPNVLIENAGLVSATTVPTIISDDGTTRLVNSGTVIGSVTFGEGDDLITNSGTFNLIGTSEFWDGNDVFANTGTVGLLGNATLTNLERFENAGRVTMANNRTGDVLTISGDYVGANGRLVLDVDTGAADTNDKLVIGGAASGKTVVGLNWLRGGALLPGRTMMLVDAKGGSAANAFVLSPDAVDAGFSRYAISHDGAEDNFNIVASEGRGLFQTLNISAGAQALWRQSADAWATRTMAQRDPARDAHEPDRIWAQFYGSAEQRDQNFAARSGDFDISYRQKHAGGHVGLDLGEIGGVTYGLTGGYLASALKFAGREDRTDYDAFSMGAYAQGEWDGYFVNALAKYDVIGARINSATAGFTETLDGRAYGLQVEAGTRFGDAGFFLEPVASLAYSRTDLDTLSALGATVDFAQSDSLRGKAGARIGGTSDIGGSIATFYLGAHLVNEFEGDGGVRFDTGTSTTVLVNDPAGTYGQFQLGATLVSKAGLTGFAEATATMGRGYQNYGGRMGLRLTF